MKKTWGYFSVLSVVFLLTWHFRTLNKPVVGDEVFGIKAINHQTWPSIMIHGADGQGSPSPAFYVLLKAFVRRVPEGPMTPPGQMTEEVYWRLIPCASLILGAALLLILAVPIFGQGIALIGVFLFLFAKIQFYFSMEARPYSSWVCISGVLLLGLFHRFRQKAWWWVFPIAGATATATLFQFSAIGMAKLLTNKLTSKKLFSESKRLFGMLALGLLVAFHYANRNGRWGYASPEWQTFFMFCAAYKWPIITSALLTCLYSYKKDVLYLWPALTIFLTFCMGPVIFWTTKRHGFFFSDRQYIYWVTQTIVLAMMLLAELRAQWKTSRWLTLRSPWVWCLFFLLYKDYDRLDPKDAIDSLNHRLGSPFTLIRHS